MHRWCSGDALKDEFGEPLEEDALEDAIDEMYVFRRSHLWAFYVNQRWVTGEERRLERGKQKAFLARYGYTGFMTWDDVPTIRIDESVRDLHDLVEKENAATKAAAGK